MNFSVILRILGTLLMLFSITLLVPILVSLWYQDGANWDFLYAFGLTLASGILLWIPTRKPRRELRKRDGFLVVTLFWTTLGAFGALPFILSESINISVTDAIFESISGLTTTGATVITGLDNLPKSILFYRQQLQWLGGLGIIVLAVAVLPILGIGGMQLYRAESPGPVKDSKLTPRITGTAKALLSIYVSLTFACTMAYWFAGMSIFDAICHSFSTVAIGGFSTHDQSIGFFNNQAIMLIASVFMFLSGINFALHFYAWRQKNFEYYFDDPECRFYSLLLISAIVVSCLILISMDYYSSTQTAIIQSIFHVVSIATTTGFTSDVWSAWPGILPFLLLYIAFIGGCAGSTGGGIKVVRVLLVLKQGLREIQRLIHPNAIIPIKLGKQVVTDRVTEAVWGFFAVYVFVFLFMLLFLLASGLDITTAFSALSAAINNLGPGLGDVASNYGSINDLSKWILAFAMLLGRLEIFTLLVLLVPMYWQK